MGKAKATSLLDDVLELPHVARPFEPAEFGQHLRRRLPDGQPIPLGEPLGEELDEHRDVLGPLAKRRHPQLDHVEPVVEVLAEPILFEIGRAHV